MIFRCICHDSFQKDIKESGREQTALSYSNWSFEPVSYAVVETHCTGGSFMELLDHCDKVDIDVVQPHSGPECFMPHPVERLLEANEDVVEILLVLKVSLTQYPQVKDLLCGASSWAKACLFFSNDFLCFRFQTIYTRSQ